MRKEFLLFITLFFCIAVNAQHRTIPEFKYNITINTRDSVYILRNSAFLSCSESVLEISRFNWEYMQRGHEHELLKFDFNDIQTISYRNRKSMLPALIAGSVLGGLIGGVAGAKIKPRSSRVVHGIFLEYEVPVRSGAAEGILIGTGLGAAIGALAASVPITITIGDDKLFKGRKKIQKLCTRASAISK